MSKTLKLTLNKQWFDLIEKGIKTEEYREIKDYWITRICYGAFMIEMGLMHTLEYNGRHYHPKKFDNVEFTNGYNKKSPKLIFEIADIIFSTGKVEWGAVEGEQYFVIKLGREVGRLNC